MRSVSLASLIHQVTFTLSEKHSVNIIFSTIYILLFSYPVFAGCKEDLRDARDNYLFEYKDLTVKGVLEGNLNQTPRYRIETAYSLKSLVDRGCTKLSDYNITKEGFKDLLKGLRPLLIEIQNSKEIEQVVYGDKSLGEDMKAIEYLSKDDEEFDIAYKIIKQSITKNSKKEDEFSNYLSQLKCDDVDHSVDMGPVRHQDGTGWCDAFVTADLVSHKVGAEVSAMDISLGYQKHLETSNIIEKTGHNRNKLTGSHIALFKTVKSGYCLEKSLPSEVFSKNGGITIASKLEELIELNSLSNSSDIITCNGDTIQSLFPGIPLAEIVKSIGDKSSDTYFTKLRDKACKRRNNGLEKARVNAIGSNVRSHNIKDKKNILKKVVEQLNSGGIAGFEHPYKMMFSSNYLEDDKKGAWHASSIVGMSRDDKGQCQFKIRGTLGEQAKFFEHKSKDGHFWISARELAANARLLFFLN